MSELSKSDLELVKLRAAKMSTKSIAMLMGGRWTEAKVYNRLAAIDGQVATTASALPVLRRIDEDLPEDPFALPPHIAGALDSRSAPFPGDPKVLLTSNPDAPAPPSFVIAHVDYGSGPMVASLVIHSGSPVTKSFELARWTEPALVKQELPDARTSADQPSSIVAADPDPQSDDAPTQAGAMHANPAQAYGENAGEAPDREEEPAPAPHPLATEARPFVPVHKVRGRKAPSPVATPAPNLLASAPPAARPPNAKRGALRLKPLTERIAGYAARFLAANWPIDEIAHLFDVSPEALEKVLG